MTSHAYYKERLGFDPNDISNEPSIPSSPQVRKNSKYHHSDNPHNQNYGSSQKPSRQNIAYYSQHAVQIPVLQEKARIGDIDFNIETSPAKKAKHSSGPSQQPLPVGGYEDALTQFKGKIKRLFCFVFLSFKPCYNDINYIKIYIKNTLALLICT